MPIALSALRVQGQARIKCARYAPAATKTCRAWQECDVTNKRCSCPNIRAQTQPTTGHKMDHDESKTIHEARTQAWLTHYNTQYSTAGVEKLASRYKDGQHCKCIGRINGGFNLCFKVLFDDGVAWAVRFPIPGWIMDPDEKVRREVAVLKFVQEKTQIPVPKLIAYGSASENHDPEIGPYIISEWVAGKPLNSLLEELPRPTWGPVLRDDIDDDILYKIYVQMADILLELASHNFSKIGSLTISEGNDGTTSWSVWTRPLTLKMNEIQRGGYVVVDGKFCPQNLALIKTDSIPECTAPPFDNVADYMRHLLQQNMTHLYKQRNSIDDEADARNKFILRRRLQALIPYFTSRFDSGPFTLFCDDVHPRNILVDENTYQITAVIDWEWTYAAPHDFSLTPPSWLVLEDPTSWIASSEIKFKKQFVLFLRALEDVESRREEGGTLVQPNERRMSTAMRQNFENGTFWFNQILWESFNFDGDVLWPHLEPILQERGLLEVGIPSEKEIAEFVAMKVRDLQTYNEDMQRKSEEQLAKPEVVSQPLPSKNTSVSADDNAVAASELLDKHSEQTKRESSASETETSPSKPLSNQTIHLAGDRADDHSEFLEARGETDANTSNPSNAKESGDEDDHASSHAVETQHEGTRDQIATARQDSEPQRTWLEMMIPSCVLD